MGYYTYYTLSITNEDGSEIGTEGIEVVKPVIKELHCIYPEASTPLTSITAFKNFQLFGDTVKWYNHEEDMIAISRLLPNFVFMLRGDGEDSGDVWAKYFQDGKYYEEIQDGKYYEIQEEWTPPPFNKELLRSKERCLRLPLILVGL